MAIAVESPVAAAPAIDLDNIRIDAAWALRVPPSFAMRKRVLPLCRLDNTILVASASKLDAVTQKALRSYLQHDFSLVEVDPSSLRRVLSRVFESSTLGGMPSGADSSSARPVAARETQRNEADDAVALCDELVQAAILRGASDIHLIPSERTLAVQLRVDGQLELYRELPRTVHAAVTSRLKVLSGLDIAEKRSAQDGRMTTYLGIARRKLDIRVATLPTRFGERITLRLLTPHNSNLSLPALGMRDKDLKTFSDAIARPHGLVLLTGPTGSGKSTTLYIAIEQWLRERGGNVITVEDPIEYEIPGASQVEVDSADKVNFSKALRSLLRHDPDVVMIGEIRDAETADIALKASLTGHLVFSTLHTNTAAGIVTRLVDMGIERFLIAATLRLSVAQRLVRRLCPQCRRPREMSLPEAMAFQQPALAGQTVYEPAGCISCAGRGYIGRTALFEMLENTDELTRLIASGASEDELIWSARRNEATLLLEDGLSKVLDGTTTVAEVTSAVETR